jgi:hypothetical protein
MQIFVHSHIVSVLHVDDARTTGLDLRKAVANHEDIPIDSFFMQLQGKVVNDANILVLENSMNVRVSLRLLGGKGGFGAMLKSMAKRSGAKKTTDFGACRDLSGRRLRHVNDEILLKKWQVTLHAQHFVLITKVLYFYLFINK